MIVINKIKSREEGNDLILSSLLEIDETKFDLLVRLKGTEWHKYAVTDRLDAFLWGVLPYAMRHGHDIKCKDKVSGKFLYNLNTQYIQTLSKYDTTLYNTRINADVIDEDIVSQGAVATGVSCGVDCLYTIIENYKSKYSKDVSLTHLLNFNEGAFGGNYYSANRAFVVKKLHAKEQALADDLGLPVINLSTNLESLLKIPVDQFIVYAMGIMTMSISKLIGKYLYSSSGGDYGDFSVKSISNRDVSYADLLSLHCMSHGATFFYSAGGAKTRFEKFKFISNHSLTKKHLFSCLNQDFNCGVCIKCMRNLLTIDALDLLDEYEDVYDIQDYKERRKEALQYLVNEIKFHGYSYSYLEDVYKLIKEKEPDTIEALEKNLSVNKLIQKNNDLEKMASERKKVIRAYKTLSSEIKVRELSERLHSEGVRHVILYYYSFATDLLINYADKLGIVIDYIVEDVKGQRRIPRLPYNSVEYPECDAVINCNIRYPKLSRRKIEERTNNRIIDVGEILDLRECL